ncbi:MAG TPA: MerR family transcriptional regulator [Gaiellaceae bacterium]
MSAQPILERSLRIGDVASLVGTTPRTIRYYEEIGLLPARPREAKGSHRTYLEADVARLRELMRLRDLLGVSLEELKTLVEAEEARAVLRERWQRSEESSEQRDILEQSLTHIESQLELVRGRLAALRTLEDELAGKRRRVKGRLRELAE